MADPLPQTPADVSETLRARADFEKWAKDEYPNANPPSAAWIGWYGARKLYLSASPQAEIDRLREALQLVRAAILAPTNSLSIIDTVWMAANGIFPNETVIDFIDAALHPATPNGDRNG